MSDVSTTVSLLLLPSAVLLLSALSSTLATMPKTAESALQHFAGGVVISATSTELVPVLLSKEASLTAVVGGFGAGVVLLLAMRETLGHGHGDAGSGDHGHGGHGGHGDHGGHGGEGCESRHDHGHGGAASEHGGHSGHGAEGYKAMDDRDDGAGTLPYSSLLATLVDFLCDGMLMGLSFSAGATAGMILVVSIALEMASVGAAVFTGMKLARVAIGKAFVVMAGLGAALFCSGIAAYTMASSIEGTSAYFCALSFGVAACLWLACEDLLVEAHEGGEDTAFATAMFFLGFLLPIILNKMHHGGE